MQIQCFTPTAIAAENVVTDASKILRVMKDGEKKQSFMCCCSTVINKFTPFHRCFHYFMIATINKVKVNVVRDILLLTTDDVWCPLHHTQVHAYEQQDGDRETSTPLTNALLRSKNPILLNQFQNFVSYFIHESTNRITHFLFCSS